MLNGVKIYKDGSHLSITYRIMTMERLWLQF